MSILLKKIDSKSIKSVSDDDSDEDVHCVFEDTELEPIVNTDVWKFRHDNSAFSFLHLYKARSAMFPTQKENLSNEEVVFRCKQLQSHLKPGFQEEERFYNYVMVMGSGKNQTIRRKAAKNLLSNTQDFTQNDKIDYTDMHQANVKLNRNLKRLLKRNTTTFQQLEKRSSSCQQHYIDLNNQNSSSQKAKSQIKKKITRFIKMRNNSENQDDNTQKNIPKRADSDAMENSNGTKETLSPHSNYKGTGIYIQTELKRYNSKTSLSGMMDNSNGVSSNESPLRRSRKNVATDREVTDSPFLQKTGSTTTTNALNFIHDRPLLAGASEMIKRGSGRGDEIKAALKATLMESQQQQNLKKKGSNGGGLIKLQSCQHSMVSPVKSKLCNKSYSEREISLLKTNQKQKNGTGSHGKLNQQQSQKSFSQNYSALNLKQSQSQLTLPRLQTFSEFEMVSNNITNNECNSYEKQQQVSHIKQQSAQISSPYLQELQQQENNLIELKSPIKAVSNAQHYNSSPSQSSCAINKSPNTSKVGQQFQQREQRSIDRAINQQQLIIQQIQNNKEKLKYTEQLKSPNKVKLVYKQSPVQQQKYRIKMYDNMPIKNNSQILHQKKISFNDFQKVINEITASDMQ